MNIGGIDVLLNSVGRDILVTRLDNNQPLFNMVDQMDDLGDVMKDLTQKKNTEIGTEKDDVFKGTIGADTFLGLGGKDKISGGLGNDDLSGGDGDDIVDGGAGADILSGGDGNDGLFGRGGNDELDGGDGGDVLKGGGGNDILRGGPGADLYVGGKGKDTFIVSDNSGAAPDIILDFEFKDTLDISAFARPGWTPKAKDLSLKAVKGKHTYMLQLDDPLSSKDINVAKMVLSKAEKNAFLKDAKIVFNDKAINEAGGGSADKLLGGSLGDVLHGLLGNDLIKGLGGFDKLFGGAGKDKVLGGGGNDEIEGGSGNDTAIGGAGNDTINGGSGNDKIEGGAGKDVLISGAGNDTLKGGGGNDTLVGGAGINKLTGGAGEDNFVFTKDALKNGRNKILDFDPDEDNIYLDGVKLDLTASEFTITDNQIRVGLDGKGGAGGWFEVEAWDGLFAT